MLQLGHPSVSIRPDARLLGLWTGPGNHALISTALYSKNKNVISSAQPLRLATPPHPARVAAPPPHPACAAPPTPHSTCAANSTAASGRYGCSIASPAVTFSTRPPNRQPPSSISIVSERRRLPSPLSTALTDRCATFVLHRARPATLVHLRR
jgi:hypothetical protein